MNISGNGRGKTPRLRRAPAIYYSSDKNAARARKADFNWPLFWVIFKLTLPIIIVIYVIYFSPVFKLKEIIVSGNEFIAKEDVISSIPLGINVLRIKNDDLEKDIKDRLPVISQVKVYKGIPNAIKIVVEEHKGVLVWQSGINYYLVSQDGTVFSDITADIASFASYPRVSDTRNLAVKISTRIVSPTFIEFVQKMYIDLKDRTNLDPDYFAIDDTTVDINMYTKNGLYIKLDSLRSADKQLNDLKLVLLDKKPEVKEYVDLRVSGWAYYK